MPTIDYYSTISEGPRSDPHGRERVVLRYVAPELGTSNAKLLDVGCGDGSFLRFVRGQHPDAELHGVDFSIQQMGKSTGVAEFHAVDLNSEPLPFPDGSFDVVVAAEVIEHVFDPDAFVEELKRVLKPGGLCVISTPNMNAWYNRLLFLVGYQPVFHEVSTRSAKVGWGRWARFKQQDQPVGHLRLLNLLALRELLAYHGFEGVAAEGAPFHRIRGALYWVDAAIAKRASWASDLVVAVRKRA